MEAPQQKSRAGRNRTLTIDEADRTGLSARLLKVESPAEPDDLLNRTIWGDTFAVLPFLPNAFADLIFIDPPYNLTKSFGEVAFKERAPAEYQTWLETWLPEVIRCLKPTGSLYICGDWKSSGPLHYVLSRHLIIRNRITFEREKGRGAKINWKNCSEDLWFATRANDYYFDVEAVRMRRKVIAPYRTNGKPKDWEETDEGNFRQTAPSNLWTDLTIPFWSMPENTDHPTQKPEKLLAKIILASSPPGAVVFDPFLGSGTTSVVAKKLGRQYVGIEQDETYCLLAEKRLQLAEQERSIQGYADGVFWERNTYREQSSEKKMENSVPDMNQFS